MDENRVIGKANGLPWYISEDLKLFKRHTSGKTVIMGRKTYESLNLPKGLPNRENIVVSRAFVEMPPINSEGILFDDDLHHVLSVHKIFRKECFVIGGGAIYKEALPYADYLYLSFVKVPAENGDTYFPEVNWSDWEEVESEEYDDFIFKKFKRI